MIYIDSDVGLLGGCLLLVDAPVEPFLYGLLLLLVLQPQLFDLLLQPEDELKALGLFRNLLFLVAGQR